MKTPFFLRSILQSAALAVGLTFASAQAAPLIAGISPSSGPSQGGTSVTITGSGFGTNAVVLLGENPMTLSNNNDSRIIATTPAGEGSGKSVVVIANGLSSNAANFNYLAPSITTVSPAVAATSGTTTVTLTGSSFGLNSTLTVNGSPVSTLTRSHTQITFTMPAGQGSGLPIIVTAAGQSSPSAPISYSAPVLTSVSATSRPTAGGTILTLSGSNFGLTPTVTVGGSPASLVQGGATHESIVCILPAGQGIGRGVQVTVASLFSNILDLDYDPPQITSVTPDTGPTAGNIPITIRGQNFGLTPAVSVGGVSAPLASSGNSHTQLVVTAPSGQGANKDVVVSVGTRQSNAVGFSYAAPQISSISYASAPTAGGTVITLSGGNFGTSGMITVNGAPATPTGYGDAMITCLLPAGQGTDLPVVVSSGGQDSNPVIFSYDAPLLATISPATGPTAGGTRLTLTGTSFGLSPGVRIGGNVAPIMPPSSHSMIVITVPAGGGTGLPVVVSVEGRQSNSGFFSYLPPAITSVSPATGPIAGGTSITIRGENFGTAPSLSIGGNPVLQFTQSTHDQIVCTLPPGSGQNKSVVVTASGQVSNTALFSYETRAFSDWAASITWNGLDSSAAADPRQTGWKNSLSYAFGVDPTTTTGGETASRNPPVHGRPAFTRNVAGFLQLAFWRRRSEIYPDLSYQVQFSDCLEVSTWEPSPLPPQVEIVDEEWEFCTFTDHSGGAGRFGRVQIKVQP